MPLVKVKPKYQVTIPATIREQVELDVGDVLEATISKEGILFKPQIVVDRESIVAKLEKALKTKSKKDPYADQTDAEIMQEAIEIVKAVRKERKRKKVS